MRETAAPGEPKPAGCRFAFDAIGTHWLIETDEPMDPDLRSALLDRVERFDATYSRFRPDSLVARIATATDGGRFDFPEDSRALFGLYDRLFAATEGAMDPLVGRELELLGYDASYSLTPASDDVRAAEHARGRVAWARDVARDGTTVITRRPLVVDVGAAGKGYLVDALSETLQEAGHAGFVVDASGDLRHRGERATRVGLEHPFEPGLVIGVAELRDRALCASGVGRRAWGGGLHHVLDARSGVPVGDVTATWAVADEAALADGLATALFSPTRGGSRSPSTSRTYGCVPTDAPRPHPTSRANSSPERHRPRERISRRKADLAGSRGNSTDMSALIKKFTTALLGVSVTAALANCASTEADEANSPTRSTGSPSAARSPDASLPGRSSYEDGEYTVDGGYGTRGSSIGVSLTLEDDEITAVEVSPRATDRTSLALQRRFADAVPELVIGRNIDDVELDRVAGNSHTPEGFNNALEAAKAAASR